jgi:hypothetical protein
MRVVNFEASGAGAVLDLALAGFGGVQQFPATFVLRLQVSRREDLQPASLPAFISARLETELVPVSGDFISPVVEIFRFPMAFL